MLNDEESILKLQQKTVHVSQSTVPPSSTNYTVRLRITPL
jgi:hypothetical protein